MKYDIGTEILVSGAITKKQMPVVRELFKNIYLEDKVDFQPYYGFGSRAVARGIIKTSDNLHVGVCGISTEEYEADIRQEELPIDRQFSRYALKILDCYEEDKRRYKIVEQAIKTIAGIQLDASIDFNTLINNIEHKLCKDMGEALKLSKLEHEYIKLNKRIIEAENIRVYIDIRTNDEWNSYYVSYADITVKTEEGVYFVEIPLIKEAKKQYLKVSYFDNEALEFMQAKRGLNARDCLSIGNIHREIPGMLPDKEVIKVFESHDKIIECLNLFFLNYNSFFEKAFEEVNEKNNSRAI